MLATQRMPLTSLNRLPQRSPAGIKQHKPPKVKAVKIAPTPGQENVARPCTRIRYSIESLRAMNRPVPLEQSPCKSIWPEHNEEDLNETFDQSFSSPTEAGMETPDSEIGSVVRSSVKSSSVKFGAEHRTPCDRATGGVGAKRALTWETPMTAPAKMTTNNFGEVPMTPVNAKTPNTKVKSEETDKRRLDQRAKQIAFGKGTLGYRLSKLKECSGTPKQGGSDAIRTPRDSQKCSKRHWDSQVRDWRIKLHSHDPKTEAEWRQAFSRFPKESSELAVALSRNPTQFAVNQCQPPSDLLEQAIAFAAAEQAQAAQRAPVARSLQDMFGENDEEETQI